MKTSLSVHTQNWVVPEAKVGIDVGSTKTNYLNLQIEEVELTLFFPSSVKLYDFVDDLKDALEDIIDTFGA